jgi:hypothetical protein
MPVTQFGVVPVHAWPQEPQLAGSVFWFTHAPLHVSGCAALHTQSPATQLSAVVHDRPHTPQSL